MSVQRKEDNLVESVLAIKKEVPQATFCVHYALKWNYHGGVEAGMEKFRQFLDEMTTLDCTVLLVSGGGKTRQLDSVAVCFTAHCHSSEKYLPAD